MSILENRFYETTESGKRKVKKLAFYLPAAVLILAIGLPTLIGYFGGLFEEDEIPEAPEGYVAVGNARITLVNITCINDSSAEYYIDANVSIYVVGDETFDRNVVSENIFAVSESSYYVVNISGFPIQSGYINCSSDADGWNNIVYMTVKSDVSHMEAKWGEINGTLGLNASNFGNKTYFNIKVGYKWEYSPGIESYVDNGQYLPNATVSGISLEYQIKYTGVYFLFDANMTFYYDWPGGIIDENLIIAQEVIEVGGKNQTILRFGPVNVVAEIDLNLIAICDEEGPTEVKIFSPCADNWVSPDWVI